MFDETVLLFKILLHYLRGHNSVKKYQDVNANFPPFFASTLDEHLYPCKISQTTSTYESHHFSLNSPLAVSLGHSRRVTGNEPLSSGLQSDTNKRQFFVSLHCISSSESPRLESHCTWNFCPVFSPLLFLLLDASAHVSLSLGELKWCLMREYKPLRIATYVTRNFLTSSQVFCFSRELESCSSRRYCQRK